jgi:hypothetical protein
MRSATWKIYFKNIRAILHTIDQCAKEVREIQTAMLVSVFTSTFHSSGLKKIPQLVIEEERQRKLTEGIKESQEVLGAIVLRMSPELLWTSISKGINFFRLRVPSLRIRRRPFSGILQVSEHQI